MLLYLNQLNICRDFLLSWMELVEDEDAILPWDVDDHCHDELTLFEYNSALAGNEFKLKCRGKEKGTSLHYHLYIYPLHYWIYI